MTEEQRRIAYDFARKRPDVWSLDDPLEWYIRAMRRTTRKALMREFGVTDHECDVGRLARFRVDAGLPGPGRQRLDMGDHGWCGGRRGRILVLVGEPYELGPLWFSETAEFATYPGLAVAVDDRPSAHYYEVTHHLRLQLRDGTPTGIPPGMLAVKDRFFAPADSVAAYRYWAASEPNMIGLRLGTANTGTYRQC